MNNKHDYYLMAKGDKGTTTLVRTNLTLIPIIERFAQSDSLQRPLLHISLHSGPLQQQWLRDGGLGLL